MNAFNGWINCLVKINENIECFLLINIIILVIYIYVLRKQIYSFFDPFFMSVFSSAMACSVVVFMYLFDLMYNNAYMVDFIVTEVAYILGLLVYSSPNSNRVCNFPKKQNLHMENFVFYIFSFVLVVFQGIAFFTVGGAIFSDESRLSFYGGGTGFYLIILEAITPIVLFMLIQRNIEQKNKCLKKFFDFLVFIFVLFSLFSTGSKGAILIVVYMCFFYKLYYGGFNKENYDFNIKKIDKYLRNAFFLAVVAALGVVIAINKEVDIEIVLGKLFVRFIGYGDIFGYCYSEDFWNSIKIENFFWDNFGSFFAKIRVVDYADLTPAIGLQIFNFFSNDNYGPNSRHNIVAYLYFGSAGGVVFSFLLGLICSYVRKVLLFKCTSNLMTYMVYTQIYIGVCGFATGLFGYAVNQLFFFLIINGGIFAASYFIYIMLYKTKNK